MSQHAQLWAFGLALENELVRKVAVESNTPEHR